MKTTLIERVAKSSFMALLFAIVLTGTSLAAELFDFKDATRRVNGIDSGRITQDEVLRGWNSSVRLESRDSSDYLYYDLQGKGLNPEEGSLFITILRDENPLATGETLLAFAGSGWKRRMVFHMVWGDRPFFGISAVHDYFKFAEEFKYAPQPGQSLTLAFAWKRGAFEVWANGNLLPLNLEADRDYDKFKAILANSRYLVLGGLPDSGMPMGAWEPISSKINSFGLYDTFDGWRAGTAISEVSSDKKIVSGGETIKVTLKGTPGLPASFAVEGVASGTAMKEVTPGLYTGEAIVPAGLNLEAAKLSGSVIYKGVSLTRPGLPIVIDSTPPAAPSRLLANAKWGGEIEVSWDPSASKDVATYSVYRSVAIAPNTNADPYMETSKLSFTDTDVIPGLTYYYAVKAIDKADNVGALSESASAKVLPGEGPAISSVLTDPLGKPMRPGQSITFSIKGATKGTAQVEILGLGKVVDLAEVGKTGVYQGSYSVAAEDSGATTTSYQVVGKLTDDYGSSKFAGPQLVVVGKDVLGDVTPPTVSSVDHDGYRIAGFSGKLVAGDVITVTMEGEPKGFASFSLVGVTARQPMNEVSAGVYKGSYTIDWANRGSAIPVEASLSDLAGNETRVVSATTVEIDTRVRLSVTANDLLLPADKTSKTRIVVKTTNANGDDVSGHELMLKLHTTDEYTGVVGGGKVANKFASKDDEDDIEIKWGGKTDSFGEVAATYTAGFAAKTALIVAKDLTSGDVGAGWLNTFVASTIAIQLTPPSAREASVAPVIKMAATPGWLTADGRSKARVRAWLTESDGTAIKGARVRFDLATDNGSIKTLRGITDATGMVEADYRAGTTAGFVTIMAVAVDDKVSGSVQIELKSDAPAKIGLVASVLSLPADGRSTSMLRALVTDINDNPNKQVPVAFSLIDGTGVVTSEKPLTDDRGLVSATYTAGRTVGTAVVEARHTSRAPTTDELRRVYGTIFVPRLSADIENENIRIEEWYAKPGEKVVRGQALVKLVSKGQSWLLHAQEDGVLASQVRHKKDSVELGDTIGYVEIDAKVWKASYAK